MLDDFTEIVFLMHRTIFVVYSLLYSPLEIDTSSLHRELKQKSKYQISLFFAMDSYHWLWSQQHIKKTELFDFFAPGHVLLYRAVHSVHGFIMNHMSGTSNTNRL